MRVLIAEDGPMERLLLQRVVEGLGHEAVLANDGQQAWARLQAEGADVLISDWIMPGLDGPELVRRVRAQADAPYTYIILLSVLDDLEHTRSGMQAGADDYLRKPLDVAELEMRLIAAARITELHRQVARRDAQLEAVLDLAQRVAAHGDPEQLLAELLAEASAMLGANAGLISLWDDEDGVLVPVRSTIPVGGGDAGAALAQAACARAVEHRTAVVLHLQTGRTAIAAPLVHTHVLGAMAVVRDQPSQHPASAPNPDGELLQRLAGIGAAILVGLDRARLAGMAQAHLGTLGQPTEARLEPRHGENLPAQPTPLIGRDAEVERLCSDLLRLDVRMVTLTGPAGVGKTRLAIAVAERIAETLEGGARLVDLTLIDTPAQVLPSIAQAVGSPPDGDLAGLRAALRGRQTLLVLDNFEHLLPAADQVGALLAECPSVKVLVTSRAPLRLSWERVVPVPPLTGSPAVELFVDRARALKPDFKLTDESAGAVAEICARLDGLPLAIELAAARAAVLAPSLIRARLERGLDWLGQARVDVPERHQTLREAIAWSYALLSPAEQRLFRHLAVFGSWDVEAAAAVAELAEPPESVQRLLDGLADQSLLVHDTSAPPDEPRFRMLTTIREYAREQLQLNGEYDAARQRHARFFVELAERADAGLSGPAQAGWLRRLAREHDNLVAALAFSRHAHAPELELRLGAALARFWYARAEAGELARRWLERALAWSATLDTHGALGLRAKVMAGAAWLALLMGDATAAIQAAGASLAAWRELGAPHQVAELLALLALAQRRSAERSAAHAPARESVALAREIDSPWALVGGLLALAELDISAGNYVPARAHLREALSSACEQALVWQTALALEGLAVVAGAQGQPQLALRLGGGAGRLREELRLPLGPADSLLLNRRLGPAQAALTPEQQAAAWREGAQLPLDVLVEQALRVESPEEPAAAQAELPADVAELTPREREVAGLVAQGLQNQQIAQRLGIAVHTVEVHVGRALRKLNMRSRAQLAVRAVERGLA